jgi:hypothetical protein
LSNAAGIGAFAVAVCPPVVAVKARPPSPLSLMVNKWVLTCGDRRA